MNFYQFLFINEEILCNILPVPMFERVFDWSFFTFLAGLDWGCCCCWPDRVLLAGGVEELEAASSDTVSRVLFLCRGGADSVGWGVLVVLARLTLDSLGGRPGVGKLCLPPFRLSLKLKLINIITEISCFLILLRRCGLGKLGSRQVSSRKPPQSWRNWLLCLAEGIKRVVRMSWVNVIDLNITFRLVASLGSWWRVRQPSADQHHQN